MPEIDSNFPRAWIEFEDPADSTQRIRADLTWLTSRWQCIYGQGCPSIDAEIPHGGCCTFGAHLADEDDEKRVAKSVSQLTDADWEMRPEITGTESPFDSADPRESRGDKSTLGDSGRGEGSGWIQQSDWIETDSEGERKTRSVAGACIFLNGPEFAAGPGCALHVLAERLGESHVLTKPDVCWQLPIRRDYETSERADGVETSIVVLTEYVRGMWGEGGHDLDWYCSSDTAAHTSQDPVYRTSRAELVAMVGVDAYEILAKLCADHERARGLLSIADVTNQPLAPHPADAVPTDPPPTERRAGPADPGTAPADPTIN